MSALRSTEPLGDLSVSRLRSRLQWGISVPDDPDHVIYVWLDALANYLTVLGYPWDHSAPDLRNAWPAHWHIVGKDILKFHAIYWPAFLMAVDLPPPRRIVSHSHWLMGREKMSKSRGNVVDPEKLLTTWGVDPVRYFLMRDGGIGHDSEFSEKTLDARYKKDLAGQLGNLVMRCSVPKVNRSMTIPLAPGPLTAAETALDTKLKELPALVASHFESVDFPRGLEVIFDCVAEANRYWNDCQPWKLVSEPGSEERMRTILYYVLETVRVSGILLQPIMPVAMGKLLDGISVEDGERAFANAGAGARWMDKKEGRDPPRMAAQQPLFPKL
ncbi:Methionine--tRNA ligase, mitochondrial [Thoreauomyces humboldtii]|nr:Methionine--tRNA ligase, mitochondrial [Thoreauomyces humboldtii]